MSDILSLLKQLVACPSITPLDAGCQDLLAARLTAVGFQCEFLPFGDVQNLWARRGTAAPLLVFAGHTDVVPPGPLSAWQSDPFVPSLREGMLYGRGTTDMKSGLAALVVAAERFVKTCPDHAGSLAFLITSDEEGPGIHGTQQVIETLSARGEQIDYCIVGEAGSIQRPGDRIRVGRRGSLHGRLTVHGKQGHVAYPEKCCNPVPLTADFIQALAKTAWDEGNDFFPPTTCQISNIHAGTGALNVVPGELELSFNFRFGTASTASSLQKRVIRLAKSILPSFSLTWNCSALPFLSPRGKLVAVAEKAIQESLQVRPELSTGGGTSDARFIALTGAEVVEIGPCVESAHEVNEHTSIDHLEPLAAIYQRIVEQLLVKAPGRKILNNPEIDSREYKT